MKIYTNDLVKGHSDFKVKCLTFGLYTQVSDSGPLGPLVCCLLLHYQQFVFCLIKPFPESKYDLCCLSTSMSIYAA